MGPYAGPLQFTGYLLGRFIVLEQAHGPTYYFGPLPHSFHVSNLIETN